MSKLLTMMMKKRKEVFSNVLDYDKTMFLCHFENNLNNLGNHSFIFADGAYNYNSDAKFGNYSVANYRNGMVWYSDYIGNYNKTLECWIKPISEQYYFCMKLADNSWISQTGFELQNNDWTLFDNANTKNFNAPAVFKTNDWNHIALTFSDVDANNYITMTLWINGELCNEFKIVNHIDIARFAVIGNNDNNTNSCLIDELVLFNYVRYTRPFELQTQAYRFDAEVVGNPTITDDYILTNTTTNDYLRFKPESSNQKSWKFTTKFRINNLSTSAGYIFTPQPDRYGLRFAYNKDNVGVNGFSCLIGRNNNWQNQSPSSYYQIKNVYYNAGEWWWVTIEYNQTEAKLYVNYSLDGNSYTNILNIPLSNNNYFNDISYQEICRGNNNNEINIDLKEVKYYIDGQLVFSAVNL